MSTTFKKKGDRINYTNAGAALSSGDVVVIGSFIGVCLTDIAATTGTGELDITGVHTLAAITTSAFTVGQQLYWDATNEVLTNVSSGNTKAGMCAAAKAKATATADVKLNLNA